MALHLNPDWTTGEGMTVWQRPLADPDALGSYDIEGDVRSEGMSDWLWHYISLISQQSTSYVWEAV